MRFIKSCSVKIESNKQHYKDSYFYQSSLPTIQFNAPSYFDIKKYPEEVINFINKVHKKVHELDYKCRVSFELNDILITDNGAIGMLLTLINTLSNKGVKSYGNYPASEEPRTKFLNTGFFDYVKIIQGKKINATDKFIVQNGRDKTNNSMVGKEIRRAIKYLTGVEESYKPLYSLIGEMISNSIEHANYHKKDKNWLLSMHYETDKVVVMVTDIGKGIMSTMRKKFKQRFKDTISFLSEVKTLYNLFDRKYQSSTFENNRNKGLPLIKDNFDNNFISNLCVITNNVYLDFNNRYSRVINSNLLGTFYSWEITNENITTWKNRRI